MRDVESHHSTRLENQAEIGERSKLHTRFPLSIIVLYGIFR